MLVDIGTQPKTFNGETHMERQVKLSFELPQTKMEGKYNPAHKGKPFSIGGVYRQSLHVKARLRKLLVGWRGRDFKTADEIEAFDPKKLVGLPCRINLVLSEDEKYVNIDSIAPLNKDELKKMPKQVNKSVYLSLAPEEFDEKVFDALNDGLKEKISKSPEFKALLAGGAPGEEPQPDAPENPDGSPTDDVPF